MSTDTEDKKPETITIQDMIQARVNAAMMCMKLNDFVGARYSLSMAIKTIDENTPAKPS